MKALRIILSCLLIAAAIGLLCYQYFAEKQLDTGTLVKAALLICSAVLSMFRKNKSKTVNKKAMYAKAYSSFIHNAFYDQPRLEKRFYDAVHDYNQGKPSAALSKLQKLRRECQRTDDLQAVTIFTALCLDEMQLYRQAIEQYQSALHVRSNSTLHSNMGLCYQRLGQFNEAEQCYESAIQADPKNAYARSNLSALYFRLGDYDQALDVALEAIEIDGKMRQALTTAAICCGILDYHEEYEKYYRQAVANGADGQKIKNLIRNLDPCL